MMCCASIDITGAFPLVSSWAPLVITACVAPGLSLYLFCFWGVTHECLCIFGCGRTCRTMSGAFFFFAAKFLAAELRSWNK